MAIKLTFDSFRNGMRSLVDGSMFENGRGRQDEPPVPGMQSQEEMSAQDFSTQEAFEKYKKLNTDVTLRANTKRMVAGFIDKFSNQILFAAAAGLGVGFLASQPWIAAIGVLAATGMSLVAFSISQSAAKEQSDKYMDVGDFHTQRSAKFVGQEIERIFNKDDDEMAKSSGTESPIVHIHHTTRRQHVPAAVLADDAQEQEVAETVAHDPNQPRTSVLTMDSHAQTLQTRERTLH